MLDVGQGKLVSKELERKASILKKRLLSSKCCVHTQTTEVATKLPVSQNISTIAQRVLVRLMKHAGHALRVRRYAKHHTRCHFYCTVQ